MTDNHIMQELRARNPLALSMLIDEFGPAVMTLTRRILAGAGTPEDIEECVSDVFVTAWNHPERYDDCRGSVRTWILILTKFTALELRRKLIRRGSTVSDATQEVDTLVSSDGVVEEVLSRERQREIVACIQRMDAGLRDVFIRRYVLHLSPADIAGELKLSRSAVDNRLWRGRTWLREQLENLEKGGGPLGVRTTT